MSVAILKKNFSSDSAGDNQNKQYWAEAARQFIPQMYKLVNTVKAPVVKKYHISNFNDGSADELGELFNKYNSDKANNPKKPRFHNYHFLYNSILKQLGRNERLNVLEIGLGTNDINVASNMGEEGSPGASLKSFYLYLLHKCLNVVKNP